ncbi:hypothetical protein Bbelb_055340 [Branchiostoma belcheri]|nr:hypothetical protein Bbelb_055340 [Branchiostoma belcheri]
MENVVELPAVNDEHEDVDSHVYNYIDEDEILNEPQTGEQTSAGTPPEAAGNNIADSLDNAIHEPGPPERNKDGVVALLQAGASVVVYLTKHGETADPSVKEYPNERLLESRMVSPALPTMTPAQAWLATTLPDNTTGLTKMTDIQPDQSTSLPGVISTDKTDNQVPRCNNGYRLIAGSCFRLVVSPGGWFNDGERHDQAKLACIKEGATLAMPKTEELDVALRDLVKTEGGSYQHWIGMEEKEGTWYWVDGSKVGSNGYKVSSWLFSKSGYPMWDDEACLSRRRFICQHPPA